MTNQMSRCASGTATSTCAGPACSRTFGCGHGSMPPFARRWTAKDSARSKHRCCGPRHPRARVEFSVPSRLHHGTFYALPQSPQLAKQLFDGRRIRPVLPNRPLPARRGSAADRQFEFSQLDMEASFASQDDIMGFVSQAVLDVAEAATGERPPPIAKMTWADALDRFGTDKPDLRFAMELIDLSADFAATEVRAFSSPVVKAIVVPDGAAFTRSRLDALTEQAKRAGAQGLAWFRVEATEGGGAGLNSPLERFLSDTEREAILLRTAAGVGDLILVVSDEYRLVCTVLGTLRAALGSPPVGEGPHRYVWVVDFPMFDGTDVDGNPAPAYHPFTMPYPEDLDLLATDPAAVRSQAYDLVLNGWELGSGSVRIYSRDIQSKIFDVLGISPDEAEARFGFLLGAFRYGAPPHAGFAFRGRPPGRHLGRRGEHPRGHCLSKDPVGRRSTHRGPSPLPTASLIELGIRLAEPPAAT